jgi:hypothetical protein
MIDLIYVFYSTVQLFQIRRSPILGTMGTRKSSIVIRKIAAQDVSSEREKYRARSSLTRFIVSVPVLSLQMVVADPMVSHAASFLTRALSSIILCIE